MISGRFDFLRTGRLLIGRRPVLPVMVLAAAPDGETEGTIGQLALVAGDRPQLWICVQDSPEWVWARITIKIQKGDSTPDPAETKERGLSEERQTTSSVSASGAATFPSRGRLWTEDAGNGGRRTKAGGLSQPALRTGDERRGPSGGQSGDGSQIDCVHQKTVPVIDGDGGRRTKERGD